MTQQKKQWSAIIIMIALFAMIAFVTNLCSPMASHRYHRYFNPMVERSRRQGKRFLGLSDRSIYQRFHHVYFELRSQPDAQLVGRWRKQR